MEQPRRHYSDIPRFADATAAQWADWQWQVAHRITRVEELREVISLAGEEEEAIRACLRTFRMAITPYYASLIDPDDPRCPVRQQAVPSLLELYRSPSDRPDPLHEDVDAPVPGLTHRYPDRVLFLVTDQCAMYCRHCTRRRFAGGKDMPRRPDELESALEYIARTPQVRDVLLSGGDALLVSDDLLLHLLERLRRISHVEIIRLGTRAPAVLPMRITDELCRRLRDFHPLYLNTHFNHHREITAEAREACLKLADAGIPVGNQSVLLRGINDSPAVMKRLVHELLKIRVRPYYLYQCDLSVGITHFRTPVGRGLEIIEALRGHTSGLGVPTYVIDAPGGGGKIPVAPQYLVSAGEGKVVLRNYEGVVAVYHEPTPAELAAHAGLEDGAGGEVPEGVAGLLAGSRPSLEPQVLPRRQRRRRAGEKAKP